MTFAEYWAKLRDKNPGLKLDGATKMTQTVDAFRRALEQAFNVGCEQGRRAGKVLDDVLGLMLGGKK